ncbi:MAG: ATP-binding protein [Candidatus Omnitrophica bacterium]|nr:ATP-binding protein [Candidatus Omnitrophota bacterium]MBU4590491.1 ATP-binding protein [Candidatus Omnitrophota bacterium]
MSNPFKFGEAVIGECFADREKETRDIIEYIKAGQNLFIYSYRRLGKTSLIMNIMKILQVKKEVMPIYVDIQKVTSQAQFIEVYASAVSKALLNWKQSLEKISNFFRKIVPSFEIDQQGVWKISFDFSKTKGSIEKSLEEVFEMPQRLAFSYKKRVVVIFDEFQEIENLNGKSFEKKIRSFIQHHDKVCYIFMGSKMHMIMDMFNNPQRAFYKSGAIYPISVIDKAEMAQFVYRRFSSSGKRITKKLAQEIVEIASDIPYNVQLLSFNVWLLAKKRITKKDIKKAIDTIMHTQNELFFNIYDSASLHQRAALYALSQTGEIFSQDTILRYNLGTASSVQASLKSLVKETVVHKDGTKYYIGDPFFKLWLQRNISI